MIENDDEYEEDESEEEEVEDLRPVFIPKSQRITLLEQQAKLKEEEEKIERQKEYDELKREKTRVKLAESLRKLEEKQVEENQIDSDVGNPDNDETFDEEIEFEAWKVREITRLKRDMEEREVLIQEKEELMRRRNMTDEERMAEDRQLGKLKTLDEIKNEKSKWKFMQKYYHKGVFYMDDNSLRTDDDVRKKDYSAPTLEDHVDKEKLPEVMRVKNFGKRGRTKYTHLVDQDTTLQDMKRTDMRTDNRIMQSYMSKVSGTKKLS